MQNGAGSRSSSWIRESQNSLGCKGPLKVKQNQRQETEGCVRKEMKTQQWHLRLCSHLVANFKPKPEDEILSGDSKRKPPPVNFLCFEVPKCLAGKEEPGVPWDALQWWITTAARCLSFLLTHLNSKCFFSATIKIFYQNKGKFTLVLILCMKLCLEQLHRIEIKCCSKREELNTTGWGKKEKKKTDFRSKTLLTEQEDLSYGKQQKLWTGTLVIYLCFHSLPMWLG